MSDYPADRIVAREREYVAATPASLAAEVTRVDTVFTLSDLSRLGNADTLPGKLLAVGSGEVVRVVRVIDYARGLLEVQRGIAPTEPTPHRGG